MAPLHAPRLILLLALGTGAGAAPPATFQQRQQHFEALREAQPPQTRAAPAATPAPSPTARLTLSPARRFGIRAGGLPTGPATPQRPTPREREIIRRQIEERRRTAIPPVDLCPPRRIWPIVFLPVPVEPAFIPPEVAPESPVKADVATRDPSLAARRRFLTGDYRQAAREAEDLLARQPHDLDLLECRALALFAAGEYREAGEIVRSILARNEPWSWPTLIRLYASESAYTAQLRALERSVNSPAETSEARFLLGYHYLVCGHFPQAARQFNRAAQLKADDEVAASLARKWSDLRGANLRPATR